MPASASRSAAGLGISGGRVLGGGSGVSSLAKNMTEAGKSKDGDAKSSKDAKLQDIAKKLSSAVMFLATNR